MADLALDQTNFDLDISQDDLFFFTGSDAIAQHLKIRLRLFKGEWFLDTRVGIPYYQSILLKNPNLAVVRNIFRRAIVTTPGVESLDRIDLDLDAATRVLSLAFSAKLEGEDVSRDFSEEFIL